MSYLDFVAFLTNTLDMKCYIVSYFLILSFVLLYGKTVVSLIKKKDLEHTKMGSATYREQLTDDRHSSLVQRWRSKFTIEGRTEELHFQ